MLSGNFFPFLKVFCFSVLKRIKPKRRQRETGAVIHQPMKSRSGIDFTATSVTNALSKIMGALM